MDSKLPDNIQTLYNQVIKYLDIIVLSKTTIDLLRNDSIFKNIFIECVGIVNFIENEYNLENQHASRYVQAYFAICNEKLTINDDPKLYGNVVELQDKVNYLNTYLINKANMDFDELEKTLKTVNEEPIKVEVVDNVENPTINATHIGGQRISDEEVLQKSGYTVHDVADQLINTQATILLNKNIASGKVFIYKSKPPIIFWIKITAFISFILILLLSIASYAILVSQDKKLNFTYLDSNKNEKEAAFSFVNFIPYIQILLFFMILMISFSLIKNLKNDNSRYYMPWGWLSLFVVFLFVITLSSLETRIIFFNYNDLWNNLQNTNKTNLNANHVWQLIEVWKIIQYCIYGLLSLIVICIVTAAVFNPKKDFERMQELHQQYAEQIRNGEIDTSGFTPGSPFGGISTRMI